MKKDILESTQPELYNFKGKYKVIETGLLEISYRLFVTILGFILSFLALLGWWFDQIEIKVKKQRKKKSS